MADAGARLDDVHRGVLHAGADEARTAPGDQQVHQAAGGHQLIGGGTGCVLHQLEGVLGQAGGHDGGGGAVGLLAAAEDAGAARLQRQRGGVAGNVGPGLVDDGNNPHGHGGAPDGEAVGPLHPPQRPAHRIGEVRHLPESLRHAGNAAPGEGEAVQHHLGNVPPGGVHILAVGGKDLPGVGDESVGHGPEGGVFRLRGGVGHGTFGGVGRKEKLTGCHRQNLISFDSRAIEKGAAEDIPPPITPASQRTGYPRSHRRRCGRDPWGGCRW